jgi:predicted RNA-binding Zn-ribbon protein involved in translation (DUF1610 family)
MTQQFIQQVQDILHKHHSHPEKYKIEKTKQSIQFACPMCGDSHQYPSRKRAHIYFDSGHFHCYNECGGMSIRKFLDYFDQKLSIEEVKFNFDKPITQWKGSESDLRSTVYYQLHKYSITKEELVERLKYEWIKEGDTAWRYLESRNLLEYIDHFMVSPDGRLAILNLGPDWSDDYYNRVIGVQTRALITNSGPKYLTYTIERLNEEMGRKYKIEPGTDVYMNRHSQIFKSLWIDESRPVTVLEGPIDSLFISNSIALAGITKTIKGIESHPQYRFLLDNDSVGIIKSKEKITQGKRVFNWNAFIQDHNLNPETKDVNDVIKQLGALPNIEPYFI